MTEYILSINGYLYILFLSLTLLAQFPILKKFKLIFSFYDPLLMYFIFNSFSVAFVIYLFFDNLIEFIYLVTFLISNVFFILGLILGNKKIKHENINIKYSDITIFKLYSRELTVILYISMFILLVGNLLLIFQYGTVPLFAENSEVAKVAFRGDGFGFVYRINDVFLPISLSIILIKLFNPVIKIDKYKILIFRLCFLALIFLAISSGSKGAILVVINLVFYILLINKQLKNIDFIKELNSYVLILFMLGICSILFILSKVGYISVFESLIVRFIGSGDAFYYFYVYDLKEVFEYSPIQYLSDNISPLLSLLRLSEYNTALGERIITESIGLVTGGFGVNAQYPIVGLIYFGFGGFWAYSLIIGYIVSLFRTKLLELVLKKPHQLNLLFYIICAYEVLKLPVDPSLFWEWLYSTIILATPVFLYAQLVSQSQLKYSKQAHK